MRTILLTGGGGYIGSHLCLTLLENGYKVVVLDSFINSYPNNLNKVIYLLKKSNPNFIENLHVINNDIRNIEFLNNLFLKFKKSDNYIEAVIHLAGLKYVEESIKDPLSYWENNVSGTINLLNTMKRFDCKKLVFSSSASIYGVTNKILSENDPIKPNNPYSKSKYVVEEILRDLSNNSSEWSFVILRYFNPIGAHTSGVIGEDCKGKNKNIFPTINNVALGLINEIQIFGDDWDTHDGTTIRDYIHIMDLVEGHILSLKSILKERDVFSVLNLGTGKGTSVKELIKTFENVNKIKIPFSISTRRKGDVPFLVADTSKALKVLNWQTKYNLEDMCRDGWVWNNSKLS